MTGRKSDVWQWAWMWPATIALAGLMAWFVNHVGGTLS